MPSDEILLTTFLDLYSCVRGVSSQLNVGICVRCRYSQKATTVSPTYAQEVRNEGPVQHNQFKFKGIRNGIDPAIWNASDDEHLPVAYDSSSVVEGKAAAKRAVKERVGLKNVDAPLVGIVSRLTLQKGVELMEHAIWTALERGCQVVVLGSAFDSEMQQHWIDIELSLRHQYHDMARLVFAYDEPLSHLIYAGSDMLLIPSTFEPCGLTQLISMRYATPLPLVVPPPCIAPPLKEMGIL